MARICFELIKVGNSGRRDRPVLQKHPASKHMRTEAVLRGWGPLLREFHKRLRA